MARKVSTTKRYYEPIPGETHKAWLAFSMYRDMGYQRSLDKAWHKMTGREDGRHARHWATWSVKNHWVSRCRAYDNAIMKRSRRLIEDKRAEQRAERFSRYW